MLSALTLSDDLERISAAAAGFAASGERVVGILPTEPLGAGRVYLCAYESDGGEHLWLALDDLGAPVESRRVLHDAASLAALCEVAEETAGGGDLPGLRATLADLREREAPEGIDAAEEAAAALEQALQAEPRLATAEYLDALGVASRRLEQSAWRGQRFAVRRCAAAGDARGGGACVGGRAALQGAALLIVFQAGGASSTSRTLRASSSGRYGFSRNAVRRLGDAVADDRVGRVAGGEEHLQRRPRREPLRRARGRSCPA